MCGVVERAKHACHIAQRAAFDPPLPDRPARIALEIDNHEIPARIQHLAEMEVPVVPDPRHVDAAIAQGLQARA